jgi:hypothetical protein
MYGIASNRTRALAVISEMSIDGQKTLPPAGRLVAASVAKTVMAMVVVACTWAW